MADKKISELTALTGANVSDANDKLAIVDASANETKYITRLELFESVGETDFHVDQGNGRVGIGTTSPTEALDVNSDAIRIRTAQTPASASAAGNAGDICWDTNYVYVCVATNTWKRSALSTW